MMAATVLQPPQVASDDAVLGYTATTAHTAGKASVTETFTIKKLTTKGTTGSITVTNGVITTYTAPT